MSLITAASQALGFSSESRELGDRLNAAKAYLSRCEKNLEALSLAAMEQEPGAVDKLAKAEAAHDDAERKVRVLERAIAAARAREEEKRRVAERAQEEKRLRDLVAATTKLHAAAVGVDRAIAALEQSVAAVNDAQALVRSLEPGKRMATILNDANGKLIPAVMWRMRYVTPFAKPPAYEPVPEGLWANVFPKGALAPLEVAHDAAGAV